MVLEKLCFIKCSSFQKYCTLFYSKNFQIKNYSRNITVTCFSCLAPDFSAIEEEKKPDVHDL